MALPLLGIGFAFSAVDKGLSKFLTGSSDGFLKLGETMQKSSSLAAGFTSAGTNLTTTWEAGLIQLDMQSRKLGVQMGVTGKEMNKFTRDASGMALTLNRTPQAMAEAVVQFERAKPALKALGVTTKEEMAKISDVMGVSAVDISDAALMMTEQFGLKAPDKIKKFFQTVTDSSRSMQDLPGWSNFLKDLKPAMLTMKNAGGDAAQFAAGTFKLAGGLHSLFGVPTAEAKQFAMSIATGMKDAELGIIGLKAGMEKDLPAISKEFTVAFTGNLAESFDKLKEDPATFMTSIRKMVAQAREQLKDSPRSLAKVLDFAQGRMAGAIGSDAAIQMRQFMELGADQQTKFQDRLQTTGMSWTEMMKQFRSGLTLQEQYERIEAQAETRFRKIAGSPGKFVEDARKSFDQLGGTIERMAADKGPLGEFVTKLSEISSKGLIAMLPEQMQGAGAALGFMVKKLSDTLGMLEEFGIKTLDFATPFRLAGLAIGGTALALTAAEAEVPKLRNELQKNTKEWRVYNNIKASGNALTKEQAKRYEELGHNIRDVSGNLKDAEVAQVRVTRSISEGIAGAVDWVNKLFAPPDKKDGKTIFDRTIETLKDSWVKNKPEIDKLVKNVTDFFGGMWNAATGDEADKATTEKLIAEKTTSTAKRSGAQLGLAINQFVYLPAKNFYKDTIEPFGAGLVNGFFGQKADGTPLSNAEKMGNDLGKRVSDGLNTAWQLIKPRAIQMLEDLDAAVTEWAAKNKDNSLLAGMFHRAGRIAHAVPWFVSPLDKADALFKETLGITVGDDGLRAAKKKVAALGERADRSKSGREADEVRLWVGGQKKLLGAETGATFMPDELEKLEKALVLFSAGLDRLNTTTEKGVEAARSNAQKVTDAVKPPNQAGETPRT